MVLLRRRNVVKTVGTHVQGTSVLYTRSPSKPYSGAHLYAHVCTLGAPTWGPYVERCTLLGDQVVMGPTKVPGVLGAQAVTREGTLVGDRREGTLLGDAP